MNHYDLLIRRSRQAPAPAIPQDFIFYAPLHENLNDVSQYGRTLTAYNGTPVFTTADGVPCVRLDGSSWLCSEDIRGLSTGNHDFTMSIWYKPDPDYLEDYSFVFAVGQTGNYRDFKLMNAYGRYEYDVWGFDNNSGILVNAGFVNMVGKYTASTHTLSLYLNGDLRHENSFSDNMDILSTGQFGIGGLEDSYIPAGNTYFSEAYVYDRALTDDEIKALASAHTVNYTITAYADNMEFSPVYREERIKCSSPNLPTFEIVSGSLPSTLTLGEHDGIIHGTAPLDDDHYYELTVRITAPNSVPVNDLFVPIYTYKNARIWIESKNFDFIRDSQKEEGFWYDGEEPVTIALKSGETLPSGITLSGNNFYSDGTATAGTYPITVVGTSEHNQTGVEVTETLIVKNNVIVIPQTIRFYVDKGEYTMPLRYSTSGASITPVYTLTGTLPAGISFNSSTGVFTSSGQQGSADSSTVQVTVASSTGLSVPASKQVEIIVEMTTPAVPDDYVWYTPFVNSFAEATSGEVGVPNQPTAFAIAQDNSKFGTGYLAARKIYYDVYGIEYEGTTTYMDMSGGSMTASLWLRAPEWSNYSQLLGGTRADDGADGFVFFADFEFQGVLDFRSGGGDSRSSAQVNTDSDWHHYVFTRDNSGNWAWYKDGVASSTGTGDYGSINGTRQNMKIGGGWNWDKCAYFDLAHFKIYNRVLTSAEIDATYHEFDSSDSSSSSSGSGDLVFHMPFTDYAITETAGNRVMKYEGSPNITTVDGIPCLNIGNGNKLYSNVVGDVPTGNNSWSIMAFMNVHEPSNANNIFGFGTASGRECILLGTKYGYPFYNNYDPDHEPQDVAFTADTWHHVAATYDGTTKTLKGYFDGQPNGSWSLGNDGLNITFGEIKIGEFGGWDASASYIASPRIYNRVLTDSEIADLAGEFN